MPENVECPTCGGDGLRTERWMEDNEPFGDGWQGYHPPCPDCDGTGEAPTPENVEEPT